MIPDEHANDFVLKAWGAWAPALGSEAPPVVPDFIPKMLQRRLSPLARAAFHALGGCVSPDDKLPAVFSSAHGEVGGALQMLQTIQAGEEPSPTAFSLSVHNAIAGLYSIAYQNQQETTVLAPGAQGLLPAFLEALGMLQEGAAEVLVVLYDEPLPAGLPIAPFDLDADATCALAMRLSLQGEGTALRFGRVDDVRGDGEQPRQLPLFIDFLRGGRAAIRFGAAGQCWQWQKT